MSSGVTKVDTSWRSSWKYQWVCRRLKVEDLPPRGMIILIIMHQTKKICKRFNKELPPFSWTRDFQQMGWYLLMEFRHPKNTWHVEKLCFFYGNKLPKHYRWFTSWWFQPLWKISVKIGSFPQVGVKIKHIWNHHLDYRWFTKITINKFLVASGSFFCLKKGLEISPILPPPEHNRWPSLREKTGGDQTLELLRELHALKMTGLPPENNKITSWKRRLSVGHHHFLCCYVSLRSFFSDHNRRRFLSELFLPNDGQKPGNLNVG